MNRYQFGSFVISKSGHDKSNIYIVVNCDGEYVYIADGKYRMVASPKRKNIKHVQLIDYIDDDLQQKHRNNEKIIDEDIKRAIKVYNAR